MYIGPTPEFLFAYRLVTGSDDTSPAAVISAIRDADLGPAIEDKHFQILEANRKLADTVGEFRREQPGEPS
jgi:hypothetical protein